MSRDSENRASSLSRPASTVSSPEGSEPKAANRSKANIRVSLACVQCRSKHIKCDATLPACNRCQQEDKPCFYAKSRRGIRDPKKRSLISDKPPAVSSGTFFSAPNSRSVVSCAHSQHDLPGGWSISPEPHASVSPKNEKEVLLDLFYSYFQPSYPCLPPKRFFIRHIDADPDSYHFLLSVINFCGSLYSTGIPSDDLREAAYSAACASLPFTVQSVQGLLLMSIAAFGEMKFEHHDGLSTRAVNMAIGLGMDRRTFAEGASDSILAESYRRTWWCLTFQDSARSLCDAAPHLPITEVNSDVDLPCEEWEYDSGIIPQPMTQSQYETQVSIGQADFSSMAYLIDICKIQTDLVLPFHDAPEEKKPEMFERADSRICDWLRRVPKWKMDLVDPDGVVDVVLYHGIAIAHVNRLRLRQHTPRNGINIRDYFPLGPAKGPDRKGQMVKGFGWNPYPTDIQAANSFCDLFRRPFPTRSLRAIFAVGALRVALAYLDACVFLGLDSPVFREALNRLVQILTAHGETWPLSRRIADDVRLVAKEYLTPRTSQSWTPGLSDPSAWAAAAAVTGTAVAVPTTLITEAPSIAPTFGFEPYQQVCQVESWAMGDSNWPALTDIYHQ
ncbi:hypothetical protein GGR52DRAFT_533792 [Hypoxylon sp. FL1284]|nr:hypothetical protein GGR52DRAFT_533792 [Hypoxylon sp. FL1284]